MTNVQPQIAPICTSNHTKIITGAGNVSSGFVPCDNAGGLTFGGSFDLNFPQELPGVRVSPVVAEALQRNYTVVDSKDLSDAMDKLTIPATGLVTRIAGDRIIKQRYEKGLLWGSTCIYELLRESNSQGMVVDEFEGDLLEERVYVAGKLEQIVVHDRVHHSIWIYSFPNPRSNCTGTNGSNEPCSSTVGSTVIGLTAGSADTEFSEYNVQLLDANYQIMMRSIVTGRDTRENTYYKDGKTWVWLTTKDGIITGSVTEYNTKTGEYRPRDFTGYNDQHSRQAPNFPQDLQQLLNEFDASASATDFV
jgi:hypothetical protein